jgi:hypothetical protein
MPKAKRKPVDLPGDFVDQIRAGDGFTDARVVMMPGEVKREALNTRRRACPALRWSWLSAEQRAMLVLFAQAADDAGYGTVRSALCAPTGEGMGNSAERLFARRQRYAAMRNACRDQAAMILTCEALDPPDRETFDQTARRLCIGSRDAARLRAQMQIGFVADDLLAWKLMGERSAA